MKKAEAVAKGAQHLANYLHLASIEVDDIRVTAYNPRTLGDAVEVTMQIVPEGSGKNFGHAVRYARLQPVNPRFVEVSLRHCAKSIVDAAVDHLKCPNCAEGYDVDGYDANGDPCETCSGTRRKP